MADLRLVNKKPASAHSPVALTFDAEIKRLAAHSNIPIGEFMEILAGSTGLTEKQLYNYRSGTCDIPALLIPIFCRHFESNALAMAVVAMCELEEWDQRDGFDLARFCASTIRDMLRGGEEFMAAFEDGRIDGHELITLKNVRAKIIRDANRLVEVAVQAHERRAA